MKWFTLTFVLAALLAAPAEAGLFDRMLRSSSTWDSSEVIHEGGIAATPTSYYGPGVAQYSSFGGKADCGCGAPLWDACGCGGRHHRGLFNHAGKGCGCGQRVRHWGKGCGCEPSCGFEAKCGCEPTCGKALDCGSGCGHHRQRLGLFRRHRCGCEPTCGMETKCGCGTEVWKGSSEVPQPNVDEAVPPAPVPEFDPVNTLEDREARRVLPRRTSFLPIGG